MDLIIERGWRDGDLEFLCKHLHPLDKKECYFHTKHIFHHIQEVTTKMGNDMVSVHDSLGRLWWLGGLIPAGTPEYPLGAYAWLLKTTFAKPGNAIQKATIRKALSDVIQMARTETEYDRLANIIWDEQKVNLRWLDSEGFIVNRENPLMLFKPNGELGTFYQFCLRL